MSEATDVVRKALRQDVVEAHAKLLAREADGGGLFACRQKFQLRGPRATQSRHLQRQMLRLFGEDAAHAAYLAVLLGPEMQQHRAVVRAHFVGESFQRGQPGAVLAHFDAPGGRHARQSLLERVRQFHGDGLYRGACAERVASRPTAVPAL